MTTHYEVQDFSWVTACGSDGEPGDMLTRDPRQVDCPECRASWGCK